MLLYIVLIRLSMILIRSDFLFLIIWYFRLVLICTVSSMLARSGITPYLVIILFSRRIIVFLLFCSLLFNSKVSFSPIHYLIIAFIYTLLVWNISPIFLPIISFNFTKAYALSLVASPTILLLIISVRNLEVALRS